METPDQITFLLDAIREAEKVMYQKKYASMGVSIDVGCDSEIAEDVEKLLVKAKEELLAIERVKADVISQYRMCHKKNLEGTYQDQLRKSIVDAEAELRLTDDKLSFLEKELRVVSALYKKDRERRMILYTEVHTMVNGLYDAVSRKVSVATDGFVTEDAHGCLRMFAEVSREREAECQQWRKYCKEMTSVVEMKKEREMELQIASNKAIASLEESKNQRILLLAEKYENKRSIIEAEINGLKEIHDKQLEQLRSAKLTTDRSGKISQQRIPPARSGIPADKFLEKKLGKHDQEREHLEHELRRIATERQKAVIATKAIQQEIDSDAASHAKLIGQLEVLITSEKQEVACIEHENNKLRHLRDNLRKEYVTV
eukprot:Tbor_TRINITY_DN5626_c0_g1::TRINITY_DN5626_c0_g1_i3::g.8139::m.8139